MDIYEYAMRMEKDGENYYRTIAAGTENRGLKTILLMLASAEVTHYKLFLNMKNNEKVELPEATIVADVKNIFQQMKEEKQYNVDVSQIELYRKAQDIEKKSRDFYIEKAEGVGDSQKTAFLRIANEESRHFSILENIINFITRPASWLENAEWYHIEDY